MLTGLIFKKVYNLIMSFKIRVFLILSVIVTLTFGAIYFAVQQNYRLTANDPQIQISESMANMLSEGQDISPFLPAQKADLNKSLATFVIVYNDAQEATVSSALLDGQIPELPKGVLDNAKRGQNRVTWQPKEGVRIASVITKYDGGYVLAGRSLREVEARVALLTKKILTIWLVTIVVTFLGTWFILPKTKSH